jgi:hypothetical protein
VNPFYLAAILIATSWLFIMLNENTDDDNDGPGGGILQLAHSATNA